MALKPWYNVAMPREDLREGRPLDASEFAVHLDQVRDGRAPDVYQKPERFFERTFLTANLTALAGEVLRRMFDLTQAEAALALALRQHGQLGTAAAALGITPGSARTRLKVVFDKVGERSQAALLRVLDAVLGG